MVQDPAYFERLQKIAFLGFMHGTVVRDDAIRVIACLGVISRAYAMLSGDDDAPADDEAAECDETEQLTDKEQKEIERIEQCAELLPKIRSQLLGREQAWDDFCSSIGLRSESARAMCGIGNMADLIGGDGHESNEAARAEWFEVLRGMWRKAVDDRYPAQNAA